MCMTLYNAMSMINDAMEMCPLTCHTMVQCDVGGAEGSKQKTLYFIGKGNKDGPKVGSMSKIWSGGGTRKGRKEEDMTGVLVTSGRGASSKNRVKLRRHIIHQTNHLNK